MAVSNIATDLHQWAVMLAPPAVWGRLRWTRTWDSVSGSPGSAEITVTTVPLDQVKTDPRQAVKFLGIWVANALFNRQL